MGNLCIKKGTSVTYSPFLMQRRKDIWGEDAEDFRPERWLTKESPGTVVEAQETSLHSAFLPFNAGQRLWYVPICVADLCATLIHPLA